MAIESQTLACATLYRLVRDFSARAPAWSTAIRYQTKPDERLDLTLVSQRVYGRRSEALVVAAAAGLESIENELGEQLLVLPTEAQLAQLKRRAGYVNEDYKRRA